MPTSHRRNSLRIRRSPYEIELLLCSAWRIFGSTATLADPRSESNRLLPHPGEPAMHARDFLLAGDDFQPTPGNRNVLHRVVQHRRFIVGRNDQPGDD